MKWILIVMILWQNQPVKMYTIEASDEEIAAEVKKVSAQFETPEKFNERLEQMGMSEEKLREDINIITLHVY